MVTHIVGHENFAAPLIAGLVVWAAAYFRIPEFLRLLPFGGDQERASSVSAGNRQPLPSIGNPKPCRLRRRPFAC